MFPELGSIETTKENMTNLNIVWHRYEGTAIMGQSKQSKRAVSYLSVIDFRLI